MLVPSLGVWTRGGLRGCEHGQHFSVPVELVLPAGGRLFEGAGAEHGNAPHRPPFQVWTPEDPTQEGGCGLAWASSPLRGLLCQSPRVRILPAAWAPVPESRASVTTPSRSPGPSLFRPHCLQHYDNSGFLREDPSFGDSRSCLRGNTGSWLVSFFNLVPSSESPASPRRPGVLTGTLLDMTL